MGNETSRRDDGVPVASITPPPTCFRSAQTSGDHAFLCYHEVPLFVAENPTYSSPRTWKAVPKSCHRMTDDPNMWICATQLDGVQRHFTHLVTEFSAAMATPESSDCEGAWTAWSACSEACGPGIQTKRFSITKQAEDGGASCLSIYGADDRDVITRRATPSHVPLIAEVNGRCRMTRIAARHAAV